ncbi:NAD(P)-binding protein [Lasiosphaeris hirsuta]|uniref:NAD(P)-binding protein n=1 Tax=Lasiosphaeris hirsuta TaxID=260670 RepID=A0AA40E6H7_9PEZI|nr:NAD(P)-binding protein [Lasiosphaeris hirsuta]
MVGFPATFPADDGSWSLVETIHQSQPVDVTAPYSTATLAGKVILITGGASGFGAAFARKWAGHGAHIFIGDLDDAAGEALVAELRTLPGSSGYHYYQHCDVTKWVDQVSLFKMAAATSPTGGIDAVVAGAGIVERGDTVSGNIFDHPQGLDAENPPPPKLNVLAVNLTGVMYTTHLAIFWLKRRGSRKSEEGTEEISVGTGETLQPPRDRHILLISSIAGVSPLPGQTEYTASKHAVMGLFRSLRGTVWRQGIRVNVLNPYFVDTPLLPWRGLALLAGGAKAEVEDVVEAGTRLMADQSIVGRGLVIGPKGRIEVNASEEDVPGAGVKGEQAIWEIYAHDYEKVEVFVWRFVQMLNTVKKIRGWIGTVKDLFRIYRVERAKKLQRAQ